MIDFDLNLNIKLTQEDKKEEKPQKNPEIPPSDKSPDLLDQKKIQQQILRYSKGFLL
ncbi:hypothetical protein [Mycoplasmopsis cynos]|uniref:hypothetical protein n=1 Tax=Mycoplasmopsis cynos TaxID=171284 RepID=UPI0024C61651|nr:hypothetical protein [Mycoplasmopsis cynos]WAM06387.1 hypothetical protein ONA23_05355 [Mycoplasmopsis cynos]WAM07676.1 hypothetical protein ONA21_06160 [Mycoplasmopsis cynos]